MVFGFGKKKAQDTVSHKEIPIDTISDILKEIGSPVMVSVIERARKIRNDIKSNQENIKDTVTQLESDDLKLDDVDKNLKAVATRGRDTVVSAIKKETVSSLSDIKTFDDLVSLYTEINQMLKRMGDVLGSHTRVMHVFARKYADKLKNELAKLSQSRAQLQNIINEHEDFKSKAQSIIDGTIKIKKLRENTIQKHKRISDETNQMDKTRRIIEQLQQDITSLKSKTEYQEFLGIKKKIQSLSGEKIDIKNRIADQLSKISRPLGKYSYVSSFDKPIKKLMEELLLEPYDVITLQNKGSIIEILHAVTKSVLAGNISVKDSKKAAEQIEETVNRLDEFLSLKDSYEKKLSELGKGLGIFDSHALDLRERDLAKGKSNLSDLESSVKRLEKEISQNEALIAKYHSELESSLGTLYGGKVAIKF